MFDAIGLYHSRWRKKKVEQFIIPPSPLTPEGGIPKIVNKTLTELESIENVLVEPKIEIPKSTPIVEKTSETKFQQPTTNNLQPKVSAFSLSSIKAKKELQEANSLLKKDDVHLPNEAFSETDMLIYWNKYAQRLSDKGHKIMESLLLMNTPKLEGKIIVHELPNEGSRLDFENEKHELLGFLRSHLKNHDLTIRIDVNEVAITQKFAFTDQDKYDRLKQINPNIELLKKVFDLDF